MTIDWFDHFLRGADNGVLDGPPARIYLLGLEDFVDQPEWPVSTVDSDFFLSAARSGSASSLNDGTLTASPAGNDEPDVLVHDPRQPNRTPRDLLDQRSFEQGCLTFTTDPLKADTTMVGGARLVLYAATDAPDVDFCVRLCDVFPDGRSRLLNTGALKGSHVRSHEHPEPLVAGREHCFEIEIWAVANLFRKDHRIRVDLSTSDFPFFESNPVASRTQIFHDPRRPSRLVIPFAPAQ
jgi:putative CocE/NonD family hydrolase